MSSSKPQIISKKRRLAQMAGVLKKYHAIHGLDPVHLRMVLEDLGPTYVKLGQIMSSRSDILSADYCKELSKLRSSAEPIPFEEIEVILQEAYGKPWNEIFARLDEIPIGAASMAQVHQAATLDGQDVVVKIQRPGIEEQMEVDVQLLEQIAGILSKNKAISSLVDLKNAVDEFWQSAKAEMDFLQEGENARKFAYNYKDCAYIQVPMIYEDLSRKNILVMEDIHGVEIDNYAALNEQGYSRAEIAQKLGLNYLDQVAHQGYFHADPHSGNLRIQDGKIVWLDFGMMGKLSAQDTRLIKEAIGALANGDSNRLADAVLNIGIVHKEIDYTGFSNALDAFVNRYASADLNSIQMTEMIEEMIKICQRYGIMLPRGITMLARSMVTMEGTMKDLDPDVNVLSIIKSQTTDLEDIDWPSILSKMGRRLAQSINQSVDIPMQASDVLRLMRKGQIKVNISLSDLESLLPVVNKMVDRIVVCVLIAALLMGSSIICTTSLKPRFLDIPLLGFAGFFISFCLSIWLFYRMLFKDKKDHLF